MILEAISHKSERSLEGLERGKVIDNIVSQLFFQVFSKTTISENISFRCKPYVEKPVAKFRWRGVLDAR